MAPSGESLSARRAWIEIKGVLHLDRWLASLSARRAWIEMFVQNQIIFCHSVALRKESVDRNVTVQHQLDGARSLSARRAWIEIL